MPNPITPIHKQECHDELFNSQNDNSISDLQAQFLTHKVAKKQYSQQVLHNLNKIYSSKDDNLTLAQNILTNNQRNVEENDIFNVPFGVSDYELLNLKTQGLITGGGRSVKITEAGHLALRDHWLSSENNQKLNREKPRFDYNSALNQLNSFKIQNNTNHVVSAKTKGRFKKSGG